MTTCESKCIVRYITGFCLGFPCKKKMHTIASGLVIVNKQWTFFSNENSLLLLCFVSFSVFVFFFVFEFFISFGVETTKKKWTVCDCEQKNHRTMKRKSIFMQCSTRWLSAHYITYHHVRHNAINCFVAFFFLSFSHFLCFSWDAVCHHNRPLRILLLLLLLQHCQLHSHRSEHWKIYNDNTLVQTHRVSLFFNVVCHFCGSPSGIKKFCFQNKKKERINA